LINSIAYGAVVKADVTFLKRWSVECKHCFAKQPLQNPSLCNSNDET